MPADPFTATAALTSAGAWLWGKYARSVTDKFASAAKAKWDESKWNAAAEKSRAKVKKLYGTMQIMGMAEPVPLDDIFADAYVCADDRWREVFLLTTSLQPDASQFISSFRREIDKLLGGDEKLRRLMYRAEIKSASAANPWLLRLSYLFTTFYYGRQSDDLALALSRALSFSSSLELALARARYLDAALEAAIARKRELNRTYARDLSIDPIHARARAQAYEIELDSLILQLAFHSDDNAPAEELQPFADRLRGFLIKSSGAKRERMLTDLQEERLISFINATSLLRDCLELAFMPPGEKKAMLNSLYLPPAQAGEGQDA
jgi:hypothetical protein